MVCQGDSLEECQVVSQVECLEGCLEDFPEGCLEDFLEGCQEDSQELEECQVSGLQYTGTVTSGHLSITDTFVITQSTFILYILDPLYKTV